MTCTPRQIQPSTHSPNSTFKGFVDRGAPAGEVARAIYDGALAGKFLIATHPNSLETVLPHLEIVLTGEEPPRPKGRRMDALFRTKY